MLTALVQAIVILAAGGVLVAEVAIIVVCIRVVQWTSDGDHE